jgi:phage-related tail fiber protein
MSYQLIFTNTGTTKIANAELNSSFVNITQFAVGDGVNLLDPASTALISEKYRTAIGGANTENGITTLDLVIPSDVGGFYIREIGLFDDVGDCIAIGTVPVTYKVPSIEGATKAVHIRVQLQSVNANNMSFTFDDTLAFIPRSDVIDLLTSTATDKPLSANQGRSLKSMIDNINTLLASDDTSLDVIQELVDYMKLNRADIDTLMSESLISSGDIIVRSASTVPSGFLECDGAVISRTTYAALFAVIGTTYGAGDGTTTFNIPDLRGEFIRGFDNGRGVDSGRTIGSSQADAFKAHSHTLGRASYSGTLTNLAFPGYNQNSAYSTSSVGGTETRPRNIAMMFCIKY